MKKIVALIIVACSFSHFDYAQPGADTKMPETYIFDHFVSGKAYGAGGSVDKGYFNYNSDDQSIVFFQDGKHYVLTNLEKVDSIIIEKRTFVTDGKIFYEKLTGFSPMNLCVSYHAKTRPVRAASTHDSTAGRSNNELSNTITDVYVTRPFNGDNVVEIQKRFWLSEGKNIYKANTEKQFVKVFSANQVAIKNYIKEGNINFANTEALVKLVAFSNQQAGKK